MESKEYKDYVEKNLPKTKKCKTGIWAFIIGGVICSVGELLKDFFEKILKINSDDAIIYLIASMIFLGSFLTGIGLYDKLGRKAGAGSIIPITGFANSIVSSAMEHNREGVFLGVCAHIFTVAGPVIVFGVAISVLAGIIKLIIMGG